MVGKVGVANDGGLYAVVDARWPYPGLLRREDEKYDATTASRREQG
jgi:hypothetical protein